MPFHDGVRQQLEKKKLSIKTKFLHQDRRCFLLVQELKLIIKHCFYFCMQFQVINTPTESWVQVFENIPVGLGVYEQKACD